MPPTYDPLQHHCWLAWCQWTEAIPAGASTEQLAERKSLHVQDAHTRYEVESELRWLDYQIEELPNVAVGKRPESWAEQLQLLRGRLTGLLDQWPAETESSGVHEAQPGDGARSDG